MKLTKIFLALLMLVSLPLSAKQCERLILAAQKDWPPFSMMQGNKFYGVSLHLAHDVFDPLDIPISVYPVESVDQALKLMKKGQVDMLATAYFRKEWRDTIEYINPAYSEDGTTIVLRKDSDLKLHHWSDLQGHSGMISSDYHFNRDFEDIVKDYLYIRHTADNKTILKSLADGNIDYAIGSRSHMLLAITELGLADKFVLVPERVDSDPVYFAFAKNSGCMEYAPYVRLKVKELVRTGAVTKLLKETAPSISKYLDKNAGVS